MMECLWRGSSLQRQFLFVFLSGTLILSMLWLTMTQPGLEEGEKELEVLHRLDKNVGRILSILEGDLEDKEEENSTALSEVKVEKPVVILMWTNYYEVKGEKLLQLIFTGRKWDPGCCQRAEVTLDRGRLEEAAAIVFFSYVDNLKITDLPESRRPDQLWILFGKESPHYSPRLFPFNSLFNWTMTYRQDSDIWAPYGEKVPLPEPLSLLKFGGGHNLTLQEWLQGKTSLVSGVISNCLAPSKRLSYAKLLNQSIPVDIYGGCGIHICPRSNPKCDHAQWWRDLSLRYKFYFAAENNLCRDYITEKFWRALELGMVPVVYGGGNYTLEAPPNSFIDTRDFSSPKALGDYLLPSHSS